jgi:hypothetical protein
VYGPVRAGVRQPITFREVNRGVLDDGDADTGHLGALEQFRHRQRTQLARGTGLRRFDARRIVLLAFLAAEAGAGEDRHQGEQRAHCRSQIAD